MATAPNQVWSWDITRLLGPKKWSYYYLYVIMDIYSRYVVGWMVADRENSALAGRLIQQSCLKHGVQPRLLTLHSDRGAPMTSQCTAQLLADLGVTRSLKRGQGNTYAHQRLSHREKKDGTGKKVSECTGRRVGSACGPAACP